MGNRFRKKKTKKHKDGRKRFFQRFPIARRGGRKLIIYGRGGGGAIGGGAG